MNMHLSATYFDKYHADMSEVEQQVRAIIAAWPDRVYVTVGETQINLLWTADADPQDVYAYLGMALDGILNALRHCPPDMASVSIRRGDRYFNTYTTYTSDEQQQREAQAAAIRDGLEVA